MVTVRHARPSDARALVAHQQALAAEPATARNGPLDADEILSAEEEHGLLVELAGQPRALTLVAESGGVLVGELGLRPISSRRAVQHVVVLGMSVARAARRRGVGRALLTEAVAWAKPAGITRIELYVYARNAAAIALYEAFGFEHEGRRRRIIREGDTYVDDLIMARLL